MKNLFTLLVIFLTSLMVHAQITTGGLKGMIKGSNGSENIQLIHKSTNEKIQVSPQKDGVFVLYNLTPGNDYTILIEGGEGEFSQEDLSIPLGDVLELGVITLQPKVKKLEGVSVSALGKNSAFSGKKSGAGTVIGKAALQEMPSGSRSLSDLTRLTPQSNGSSFAGASNRFNNLSIDGAQNNDAFGLGGGAGLPGAGAGTQPISLDAIQEVQVVLSPYNVTFGNFAGAGINAITRSGSNTFEGSAYAFYKSNELQGVNPVTGAPSDKLSNITAGVRVGGPIIKNKLFFFANIEVVNLSQPSLFNAGEAGARISTTEAKTVSDFFKSTYSYDVGSSGVTDLVTANQKVLLKLDYIINSKHKLSFRHNFINASKDILTRNATTFQFSNAGYLSKNMQNVSVIELKSTLSNNIFNNLIVGYSNIQDRRDPSGQLFPSITVANSGVLIGTEPSSNRNSLSQQIIELTDNLKIIEGKHTFTFGTHNELFLTENSFANRLQGQWRVNNLSDLTVAGLTGSTNVIQSFAASYPLQDGGEVSNMQLMQLGFYAQSESDFTPRLTVTYGIRLDVPIFLNSPSYNADFAKQYGIDNSQVGSGQLLWSPRLGFKYAMNEQRTIQVRGGIGIFTGRIPLVWMSNNFGNDGIRLGSINSPNNQAVNTQVNGGRGFNPDPSVATVSALSTGVKSYAVNVVDKNFTFPQTLRANLAFDFKLPAGIELTAEAIYSSTLNGIYYKKLDFMKDSFISTKVPTSSALTFAKSVITSTYLNADGTRNTSKTYGGGIYYLGNTSSGYAYTLTVQASKKFDLRKAGNLGVSVAYTYGESKDINSGTSSVAASNFGFNFVAATADFNNPPLTYSVYDIRHNIVASLSYKVQYAKHFATTVSLFLSSKSGSPFSLNYNSDVNGDGANTNDLVYIPTVAEVNAASTWTQSERDALNNLITSTPELDANRGTFSARNSLRTPWEHIMDVRVLQDFMVTIGGHKHTLQLSWEVFNFGNLLNQDWGKVYSGNTNYTVINGANGKVLTTSSSSGMGYTSSDFYSLSIASRWSMQLGVRYTF